MITVSIPKIWPALILIVLGFIIALIGAYYDHIGRAAIGIAFIALGMYWEFKLLHFLILIADTSGQGIRAKN